MTPKYPVLALAICAFASPSLHATSGNMEQEYQQERTIALRDPKVRAAYEEADRKLEAKIVQIDPALAGYHRHGVSEPAKPASTPTSMTNAKAAPVKGGFHAPHAKAVEGAPLAQTTHAVAKGETLGGIASRYGVTIAALKTANHITDEKKLAIGQVLTIPQKAK